MLKDIVDAQPTGGHCVKLRFEDGVEGIIDLSDYVSFHGVFEPLRNPDYFRQVRVDSNLGTIAWPNGADLDPDVLYARITGEPISVEQDRIPVSQESRQRRI